jgi:ATP-dependent DNA helicase RecG
MSALQLDITAYLHKDEGQHYERKSMFEGPEGQKRPRNRKAIRDQVADVVAGFANAEGGVLILGIEDDHKITGHDLPTDAIRLILYTPQERLTPQQPAGYTVSVAGKELIVFDVPPADIPVQVIGDGFPLRTGDNTIQSTESHIRAAQTQGFGQSWESRPTVATLAHLDLDLIARARHGAGLSALSDEAYLLKRKLADMRGSRLQLRNAAELVFAQHEPDHPNAGVRIFRVIGTERRTGVEHNVEELPRIEGNLPTVIETATATITGLLRKPSRLFGTRFRPMPEYPEFTWKEALLNAIAHRDYAVEGSCTEIWLFDDRMEVRSPGGFIGDLTIDEVLSLKPVHRSRNPRLMRILVDIGVARDQGEGIPRMFAEMTSAFLPQPEISESKREVRVTLRNELTLSAADRSFIARLGSTELSDIEMRALIHTHQHGRIENNDLRLIVGIDTNSASQLLRRLRDRNLLELHAHGANSYYTLPASLRNTVDTRHRSSAHEISSPNIEGSNTGYRGEQHRLSGGATPVIGGSSIVIGGSIDALPPEINDAIRNLGARPRVPAIRAVILSICSFYEWTTAAELAIWLDVRQDKLTERHLSPLVKEGTLIRRYPDTPTHQSQAYRSGSKQASLALTALDRS